ncbi:SpoIIE family protein phosphatase [Planctomyces sp. SH-PL62]|uniref:SpoIIE family protein phosphatase n=1 Tax=Planctomyces sp. SH-PL62 TaxID=1636152 RepID=UPI00078EB1B9|nr:SpoIIE family protein phosphatase [Planctomyces sp. SH-PL62]AMV37571.1 Phosphoserine phosphatase RsbU [Planctomyces sp. SH-PL62]
MAFLKRANGDSAGQIIELGQDRTVIGRSPEQCQIVLDPNGVSRRHAEIYRGGEDFFVRDLKSRNMTKVNNVKLTPGSEHRLVTGDRINICDVEFVFHSAVPGEPDRTDGEVVILADGESCDIPPLHTFDASRSSSVASMVKPEVKLRAILEITRDLSTELKIDQVAPRVLDSLAELFPQAERLFLLLVDPLTKRLVRKATKIRQGRGRTNFHPSAPADEAPMQMSRSLVNHVLGQKKAVLSQDASTDKNLPTSASIADLKIRSVMCVPMLTPNGEAVGIIQLDTSDRKQFHQEDLDVLAAVAGQAAIAIQNAQLHESLLERERLNRDLKLAEQVQKRFLPQEVPQIAGYEFFAHYEPAYEVGGDYYDFVPLSHGRLAVALGDVSGKGVAAALMMAKFSGDTRYCILTENDPGAAAAELNALLFSAGIEEKFITLSLCVLDARRGVLSLASAGHLPIIVRRADGRVEEVGEDIAGFPLGIVQGAEYRQDEVRLEPGDVVVVYSDGVTDSRNLQEQLYDCRDDRRLLRRIAESPGGPEAVGKAILQDIREYSLGHVQADDITLVCFGPKPV